MCGNVQSRAQYIVVQHIVCKKILSALVFQPDDQSKPRHSGLNFGFSYFSGKWRSVRRSSGRSDGRPTFLRGGS